MTDILEALRDPRNDGHLNRAAAVEIKRLREELTGTVDRTFRQVAYHYNEKGDGPWRGWWGTMSLSLARDLGDRLVKLGKWERHPEGCGRRWFYRPIATEAEVW